MKRFIFAALCLLLSSVQPAPVVTYTSEKENFCHAYPDHMYARFRLYMKIQRNLYSSVKAQCTLDIETEKFESLDSSSAYVDASGINASISIMGENVYIPINYVGIAYDLKDENVYVNVSSFRPWIQTTKNLAVDGNKGLEELLKNVMVSIDIGCDSQIITPGPYPTPPPPKVHTLSADEIEDLENSTPPTPDVTKDRKRKPDKLEFSLLRDPACIKNVEVYFELMDACLAHKKETPLRFVGKTDNGEHVRKEVKQLDGKRRCSMNLDSDYDDEELDP
ncbi:putative chemokine-binding protein [Parapoxvirus red deer/HL953]|uniref:Chemokine binding protein 112.3 n=2 Tax=Parapoxvirus reddeerpox TaxID=3431391 RepID=A0A516EL52_9POXV|nr:putative chemokine-binding protein [Parapoxvirus red deer/HL953]AIZ77365.1 putative chemokine-binding protein [Parapoxvirus red deer/HL953]QDO67043.1 chemokine binding protein 112.3 [Parapoxvirus of red deer in New Zealand]